MGSWGWERGDEYMEIFSENRFSKIFFPPMMKTVYLFTLQLKHGQESDCLLKCLFLDNIFLFGWEHWDGSMGAGAWGWE